MSFYSERQPYTTGSGHKERLPTPFVDPSFVEFDPFCRILQLAAGALVLIACGIPIVLWQIAALLKSPPA